MSGQPFAELICAYLDGLPGAAEVLNDALEESGRARTVVDGTAGERLTLVLEQLLDEPIARQASVDFARHVMNHCNSAFAQAVYRHKQLQVDPRASATDIREAQEKVSAFDEDRFMLRHMVLNRLGWSEENTPKSNAAWALWGALQIPVRFVAQAAQRANTSELDWQIDHLKQLLK